MDDGVMGAQFCAHDPIVQPALTEGVNVEVLRLERRIELSYGYLIDLTERPL